MQDAVTPEISAHIRIVGRRRLQNELMANFLSQEIGLKTLCISNCEDSMPAAGNESLTSLTIVDWGMPGQHVPIEQFATVPAESNPHLVLFWNVARDQGVEWRAIKAGIRGLFYEDDPLQVLVKGVQAVLRGEIWYSRETLSKAILSNSLAVSSKLPEGALEPTISSREREVLSLLANGGSNDEIAEQLNISPHTVRTHLCNIYGKIKVNSRIQAMLWAAKYL